MRVTLAVFVFPFAAAHGADLLCARTTYQKGSDQKLSIVLNTVAPYDELSPLTTTKDGESISFTIEKEWEVEPHKQREKVTITATKPFNLVKEFPFSHNYPQWEIHKSGIARVGIAENGGLITYYFHNGDYISETQIWSINDKRILGYLVRQFAVISFACSIYDKTKTPSSGQPTISDFYNATRMYWSRANEFVENLDVAIAVHQLGQEISHYDFSKEKLFQPASKTALQHLPSKIKTDPSKSVATATVAPSKKEQNFAPLLKNPSRCVRWENLNGKSTYATIINGCGMPIDVGFCYEHQEKVITWCRGLGDMGVDALSGRITPGGKMMVVGPGKDGATVHFFACDMTDVNHLCVSPPKRKQLRKNP